MHAVSVRNRAASGRAIRVHGAGRKADLIDRVRDAVGVRAARRAEPARPRPGGQTARASAKARIRAHASAARERRAAAGHTLKIRGTRAHAGGRRVARVVVDAEGAGAARVGKERARAAVADARIGAVLGRRTDAGRSAGERRAAPGGAVGVRLARWSADAVLRTLLAHAPEPEAAARRIRRAHRVFRIALVRSPCAEPTAGRRRAARSGNAAGAAGPCARSACGRLVNRSGPPRAAGRPREISVHTSGRFADETRIAGLISITRAAPRAL